MSFVSLCASAGNLTKNILTYRLKAYLLKDIFNTAETRSRCCAWRALPDASLPFKGGDALESVTVKGIR